jgi:hypothetical protein
MATSLARQTKESFEQAQVAIGGGQELVSRARATTNEASGERDRLLLEIVLAYRLGPQEPWASALLDLLTPAVLERLKRYDSEPPAIDPEDVRQQFVLELLTAAAKMPLPLGSGFIERRLILRAGQGVRRWLARERRWRALQAPITSGPEEDR